jgi:hypothetical protein
MWVNANGCHRGQQLRPTRLVKLAGCSSRSSCEPTVLVAGNDAITSQHAAAYLRTKRAGQVSCRGILVKSVTVTGPSFCHYSLR